MQFKDILVLVDDSPQSAARIDVAISLAKRNGAHLTGLYVITHSHYSPLQEGAAERMEEARRQFSDKTSSASVDAEWSCVDWPVSGVSMAEIVTRHGYYKDLIIVGQVPKGQIPKGTGEAPSDLPERVVKASGRPVLVVPFAGSFPEVGSEVMVAWNGGRESVRALRDAMPFLQFAERVSVLAVRPADAEQVGNPAADLAHHLDRHGVKAEVDTVVAGELPVGDIMLNAAWEKGCNLLVMGAYTYSSRGTLALGAVARHILDHMPMPVLMSH